jgi:type II secretory pathway pseudopilin PulG
MVTIAVIAILAVIAVPMFSKESKKSKATSEVGAMFAELAIREDQYKLENGSYRDAAACPSTPSARGQDASGCLGGSNPWQPLRVRLPTTTLHCSYTLTTDTSASTTPPTGVTFNPPGTAWFFIVATCDMDGDSTNSTYFTSSADSKIQKLNDGE